MRLCKVIGCRRKHAAKGFCDLHYQRSRQGTPENQGLQEKNGERGCLIKTCENKHHCKGYCAVHWERVNRLRRKEQLVQRCGNACHDCGGSFPSYVFDFDNVMDTPGHKAIGKLLDRNASDSRIQEELARCELVCANCHRIRTYTRYAGAEEIQEHSSER